jgi:hypothetical protein
MSRVGCVNKAFQLDKGSGDDKINATRDADAILAGWKEQACGNRFYVMCYKGSSGAT